MKLQFKFNLVLILAFLLGLIGSGFFSYNLLQKNAREEVLRNAGLMMDMAIAIRGYTVDQVRPHLADKLAHTFLPQSVPAYAATETISELQKRYPDYSYKEATINPTNPRNRAQGWEWMLVKDFQKQPDRDQVIGEREQKNSRILYMARPIKIKNEACLSCHSEPKAAPVSMVNLYGARNGFGWKLNEVVGVQMVTVPMALPVKNANEAFLTFMASLLAVFLILFIAINLMLNRLIIKPIANISSSADRISTGDFDINEFPEKGRDEISVLGTSFNRMRRSLHKAMQMATP